ncbi:tRNA lysidine(34) synthetase TilS [Fibrobacter sp.]|uniref:tRNA lysidine(34) synthetase TilS n=1 Tax=Fibrobacter sp. TaxID=35828 RepID=UPI00386BE9E1
MSFDIANRIRHHGFKRLLLAVSGGLDSICLAHYFTQNREALGIEWLGIAHVHHGLREGTADRDAAFVEAFARKYDIPFFLKKLDGEALKTAEGSLEENARDARYKALVEIASTRSNRNCMDPAASRQDDFECIIVTAHHAGDQAETMYMRLRRGTTLAGLRGIQETREICDVECEMWNEKEITTHYTPHITHCIYRPLLNTTRAELLEYAREHNLTWCEDESNADVKFARNKVRHEWLPQLEQSNAGATKQLCKVAGLADKAYGKVMEKCEELFNPALQQEKEAGMTGANNECMDTGRTTFLNKKSLRKILLAHADTDLSEMFRLWLSEQGFRFPIGFFFDQKEPAHVKIPVRAAYRKRAIAKNGSTVRICEFETVEAALKFVSCK